MTLPLAGKVAIVTGSSRSIGAAVATRLAAQGANVVINYVANASAAQGVADTINSKGAGKAVIVQANVAKIEDNTRLVEETLRQLGRIDILVLNAGTMALEPLPAVTADSFDAQFDTNVKGPLFLVQTAAPHIEAGTSGAELTLG